MAIFERKRKAVSVDRRWLRAWPKTRPIAWWIEVGRKVSERRVAKADMERVREVCAEVEREWQSKRKLMGDRSKT